MIASFDADNIDVRQELAQRYLAQGDGARLKSGPATACTSMSTIP